LTQIKTFLKKKISCVDFRMFAAKKEHSRAHPVTQTGKSSGRIDGALVGSTDEANRQKPSTTGFVWPVARFAAKKEHSTF
jgi:hypothetical protein